MILMLALYIPTDKKSIREKSCWTCKYLRTSTNDLICHVSAGIPIVTNCSTYVFLNAAKKLLTLT